MFILLVTCFSSSLGAKYRSVYFKNSKQDSCLYTHQTEFASLFPVKLDKNNSGYKGLNDYKRYRVQVI
jgi:hypothetical protein